ncbi:MAG: hypothetical protein HKN23_05135, partial [Verrucomicrobiales bacterium]|nr:hypothetical protein [Verrucomicrobiales bacterium]
MKLFRRLLMFFAPIAAIALVLIFVPAARPDLSKYRELRLKEFYEGIDIKGSGSKREVTAWFESFAVKGFIAFDFGKIRVAIHDFDAESQPERLSWSGAGDHQYLDTPQPVPPAAPTAPTGSALPPGAFRG